MAQQIIDIGNNANDGTGDTIRQAGSKINAMFDELYIRPSMASNIRIVNNKITTNSSNADIDLQPSGTGSIAFPAIKINGNNIEATRSNEDLGFVPQGSGQVVIGGIGFGGTSISAKDSTIVNFNDSVNIDGNFSVEGTLGITGATTLSSTLNVSGLTTLSTLTLGGAALDGTVTIDNLIFSDKVLATSSNADLRLEPGGTGSVVISNITFDNNINITDNEIKGTKSNSDMILNTPQLSFVFISFHDFSITKDFKI